jgi:hypothetical protein
MATTRGQFAQLLAPGLAALLFEWLREHPEEYSQYMNVQTSDMAYDEDQVVAGLGLARTKPENEQITYDDPIQGGTKRYLHQTYALGWQVTMEMKQDDKYALMQKVPAELMKSCRQTWEQLAGNVLLQGNSTITTADGVTLFNTAHPLLGGGTYSNQLSPLSDLSVTALQDILILYENMPNERGLRVMCQPRKLWIPPEMQFVAQEVLQSQYRPYTGTNEINSVQGRLEPAVLHFWNTTTGWTVSTGEDESNNVKFKWRAKPTSDTIDDFETKGTKHSIIFRVSAGATDWRGWAQGNA